MRKLKEKPDRKKRPILRRSSSGFIENTEREAGEEEKAGKSTDQGR
jgi:hypothetical protein